jgi:chemotaxis protein CheX
VGKGRDAMEQADKEFLQKRLAQAVFDVFGTMAGIEPSEVKESLDSRQLSSGEITGAMMLPGARIAMLSLTMSKENAKVIVSYMTGSSPAELADEELYDGVAEMVNMIAGRGKALLAGTDYHYIISPPFTIVGENHFIVFKKKVVQIVMKFNIGESILHLRLSYL